MKNDHKLGLVSISFRSLAPKEILEAVKAAGLSCVEWGSDVHAPCTDPERIRQIAAMQNEYGISCSSYGTYFRLGVNPPEEIRDYIRAAKLLGTNLLRIWCGDKNDADMTEEERQRLICDGKAVAAIAEAEGVVICMECHNKTMTDCIEGAERLMSAVNSHAFQMYWQPNQFKSHACNCDYARRIRPYVKVVHVFHWINRDRFPLAEGAALWRDYLSCLDGSLPLLLEFMPDNDPRSLSQEADSLRLILNGMGKLQ